jgi:hypothetical protein
MVASPLRVSRTRSGDRRKTFKRLLWLTSGPSRFSEIFKIFHLQNFEIQKVTFPMSTIHQILHRDSWKNKEQLYFLAQL